MADRINIFGLFLTLIIKRDPELDFVLPQELLNSLEGVAGFDAAAFKKVHEDPGQGVSIRFNPAKYPTGAPLLREDVTRPVPWSSFGYYLARRPSFTMDPLFHAGAYYVQEASSMFLEQALRQTVDLSRPLRVLDLCAAPGGKSTLIQSLISAESLLVSNEVIRSRAGILQENMIKWGAVNTIVTQNDPRDFGALEHFFDVIVVDAPCSGSGLFRRDPAAIGEWSLSNVQLCGERQQRILADCWPALKPGGILVYSTCSYSRQEDEEILEWMMAQLDPAAAGMRLTVERDWNIVESEVKGGGCGYRFYPDKLDGEGLFIACVQKPGESAASGSRDNGSPHTGFRDSGKRSGDKYSGEKHFGNKHSGGKRTAPDKLNGAELDTASAWLKPEAVKSAYFFRHADLIHLLPGEHAEDLSLLRSKLYLRKAGLALGQAGQKEFIPEHELAMSPLASPQIAVVTLSLEEAIRYLRKEEIGPLPGQPRKGWALVQYEGYSLGWIKVLPNRINNYYPKDWRILKR